MSSRRASSSYHIVAGSNAQLDQALADRLRTLESSRSNDPDRLERPWIAWREPTLWAAGAAVLWLIVAFGVTRT